jgi:hypothetical protein
MYCCWLAAIIPDSLAFSFGKSFLTCPLLAVLKSTLPE